MGDRVKLAYNFFWAIQIFFLKAAKTVSEAVEESKALGNRDAGYATTEISYMNCSAIKLCDNFGLISYCLTNWYVYGL